MPLPGLPKDASTAELYRVLAKSCPLLDGRMLTDCALDATGNYQAFLHNLGRAYQGAIVVGWSSAQLVRVCPPTDVNFPTGTGPATHVLVRPTTFGGATPAMTFNAWVF